jgi:hypothetical protein
MDRVEDLLWLLEVGEVSGLRDRFEAAVGE